MSVNVDRMRLLVAELRSGNWKQTTGTLTANRGDGLRHCCLGVATEVAIRGGCGVTRTQPNGQAGRYIYVNTERANPGLGETNYLHPRVRDWYGLDTQDPQLIVGVRGLPEYGTATQLNDAANWSLSQIADAFEKTFLPDDWAATLRGRTVASIRP
jgi:hypothetical protein